VGYRSDESKTTTIKEGVKKPKRSLDIESRDD
jgi:hypothetical protein